MIEFLHDRHFNLMYSIESEPLWTALPKFGVEADCMHSDINFMLSKLRGFYAAKLDPKFK